MPSATVESGMTGTTDDAAPPDIETVFPELAAIEDPALREGVRAVWTTAYAETGADPSLPWLPPDHRGEYPGDVTLVGHLRDVTAVAIEVADALTERGYAVDLDLVIAGALVHDVSKPYEFDDGAVSETGRLVPHPHYGVHLTAEAGLPVAIQHVVLSHSGRGAVEPATLEAEIVARADEIVSRATRLGARTDPLVE